MARNLTEINMTDVPNLSAGLKYFDGDVAFADRIMTVPSLQSTFKVNFLAFVFCLEGSLNLKLNGVAYVLEEHDALFVGTNTVVSEIEHSADFSCKIIVVTADFGLNFINKTIFEAITQMAENPVIKFTEDEMNLMMRYYELAIFKIEHPGVNYGKETLVEIFRCYALDLLSSISRHIDDRRMLRQADKLFHHFIIMLAENRGVKRSVQSFAEQLYVTPKYLTSVCREKSGKTASELITLSVIGRIKQLLQYSGKSIKEIASEMGFDNLSFFGKYVRKHLGMSPNKFRQEMGYGR
jgi:AraC-like DNA-binding protein